MSPVFYRFMLLATSIPLVAFIVLVGFWLATPTPFIGAIWAASGMAMVYVLYGGWQFQPLVLLGSIAGFLYVTPYGQSLVPWIGFAGGVVLITTTLGGFFTAFLRRLRTRVWEAEALKTIFVGSFALLAGPLLALTLPPEWVPTCLLPLSHFDLGAWWGLSALTVAVWAPVLHILTLENLRMSRRVLAISPALVLMALSGLIYKMELQREQAALQEVFEKVTADIAVTLTQRMAVYQEILLSVKYFFDGSEYVDAEEFSTFSARFYKRHPSIQALAWAPHVKNVETVIPHAWHLNEGMQARQENHHHFIVKYIEGADASQQASGFDLMSESRRRKAIMHALNTGDISLTAPIDLITTKERGFLMLAPVYARHEKDDKEDSQWNTVDGMVVGAFSAEVIVNELLAERAGMDVYLTIRDVALEGDAGFIYTNQPSNEPMALSWDFIMPIGGQRWQLSFVAGESFFDHTQTWSLWLFMASLLFCGGVGLFQLTIMGRSSFAERLVAIRTRELSHKQADLAKAKREAERISDSKTHFLASFSHEIRVPLSGISGAAELLKKEKLTKNQAESVKIIDSATRNIVALLGDVLDITRIESGRLELNQEIFNLHDLCREVMALTTVQVSEGVGIGLEIAPQVPRMVGGDAMRIRQVLSNLMNNAAKYTKEGHITLSVKLESQTQQHARLIFVVEDTGAGVPSDKQQVIFEKFRQASIHDATQYGGSGMGLAICYELCKLMGGYIDLESELGEGSRFIVHVPLLLCGQQEGGDAEPVNADLQLKDGTKVLVAEDNPINQKVVSAFLEHHNAEITLVNNGLAALEYAKREQYDLIVMDVQMPELTGPEAAVAMRNAGVETPIVAITGNATVEDRKLGMASGMNDYLLKPIRQADIVRMLHTWIPKDKHETAE